MRGQAFLLALLLPLGLAACAFLDAVGFISDDRSFKSDSQEVVVEVFPGERQEVSSGSAASAGTSDAWSDAAKREFADLAPDVLSKCLPRDLRDAGGQAVEGSATTSAVDPVVAPILMEGANAALNTVADEIAGFLEDKERDFIASYDARMNDPKFRLEKGKFTQCIQIVRRVTEKSAFESANDCGFESRRKESIPREAMRFIATVEPFGDGFVLRPLYLKMAQSAARTGLNRGVNLKISVGISTLRATDGGMLEPGLLTVQDIVIPGVKLTGTVACPEQGRKHDSNTALGPKYFGTKFDSPVFGTSKPMPTPATIVVAVTETGSGASTFADARKDFDRNVEAIRSALGGALNARLSQ